MLKLFNSYTREPEEFKPLRGKTATMYNCGPTVYDFAHIGNLRTYLFADVLRRTLEHDGYKVKQVMNITDVGHMLGDADTGADKIEEAAKREHVDPKVVAAKYEAQFMSDISRLNIEPAFKYPRASEHVDDMIKIISILLKKGFAYEAGGDIYFDISKFPNYGALSGNTIEALKAGARVEVNDKKKNPYDFALWIANPNHLLQWDSLWGKGYPGWHIECSAMSTKYLGKTVDIHTGAEDNKFPHHECEIAQSEAATGKPFVRFWLHAAHLLVDGQKMSKSLNNFYTLDDLIAKGYAPRVIRYALISSHYREQQNFTFESLSAAASALEKIDNFAARLAEGDSPLINMEKGTVPVKSIIETAERDFYAAMDDDLNTPKALGALFTFVRELNAALDAGVDKKLKKDALKALKTIVVEILGLTIETTERIEINDELKKLLAEREAARAAKDFVRADEIRKTLSDRGYAIEDSADGARLKKV
jgi:cysteinyl-tRNA synthetase